MRSMNIDASIRSPFAGQYRPQSEKLAGHALLVAEARKRTRYPDLGGLTVTVAAVETLGRLGQDFRRLLDQLSAAYAEERRSRGLPCRAIRSRWMAELSVLLAWHVGNAVLQSHKGV